MTQGAFYTGANGPTNTVQYATTPRYLAGGGDPRRVTEVLRTAGWSKHSDPGYPHVLLASPDMSVRLALEPSAPDPYTAWWQVNGQGWYAHFGGHAPAEIIAGFSDALLQPAPQQPPALTDIREVLDSTGWTKEYDRKGIESALSPDGFVRMGPHPSLDSEPGWPTWYAEAALPTRRGGHERLWQAWFSHNTPTHLVAGFAEELVSTEPLFRGSYGLPCSWLLSQEPTTVQGEDLAEAHHQRVAVARAAAHKQRKAAAALRARAPLTPAPVPSPVHR